MKTSDAGIYAIALHEGIVPAPYYDSVGVLSFGIGHTSSAGYPDPARLWRGMPEDIDDALVIVFDVFRRDLQKYEAGVNRALKVSVTQAQFDALVSFHYNTGAIAKASFVKRLNAGDIDGAAAGFMAWKKPPEIIFRRRAEQKLYANGVYPEGLVTVWGVTEAGRVVWKPGKRLNKAQVMAMLRHAPNAPATAPVAHSPTPAPAKPATAPKRPNSDVDDPPDLLPEGSTKWVIGIGGGFTLFIAVRDTLADWWQALLNLF